MTKLSQKNETALKFISKRKEVYRNDVTDALGIEFKDCIRSLMLCGFISVVRTVVRKTSGQAQTREMNVYAITERGMAKLRDMEFPILCSKKKPPVQPVQPQLHKMESFVLPVPDKNAKSMIAEIDGRMVKITHGTTPAYEVYRPAPDYTRYKPNPIKGIHAL